MNTPQQPGLVSARVNTINIPWYAIYYLRFPPYRYVALAFFYVHRSPLSSINSGNVATLECYLLPP